MNLRAASLAAASCLLGVVVACSGAEDSGLFAPPGSSEFASEPPAGGDQNQVANPSSSGASGLSSTGGTSSSSSSSSSGGSTSGSTSSGSTSSGGTVDAGTPPPPAGKIYCGAAATCSAPAEICCVNGNFGGAPTLACEPAGLIACVTGRSIACDDSSDCASGQVCCGQLGDNGYTDVKCVAQCKNSPGVRGVRFCNPAAPVDECVSIGKTCSNSQQMPGYHVCN